MKPKEETPEIVKGSKKSTFMAHTSNNRIRNICVNAIKWEVPKEVRESLLEKLSHLH